MAIYRLLPLFVFTLSLWGCFSSPPPVVRIKSEERWLVHLVRSSSETVPSIAKWYTGTDKSSKQLLTKNIGTSSSGLHPGARVLVPMSLLKTTRPMPTSAVPKKKGKVRKEKITPQATYEEIMDDLNPSSSPSVSLPPPLINENNSVERDVVEAFPTETPLIADDSRAPEANTGNSFDPSGRSLEEIVAEEEEELKKLRKEMEQTNPS